MRVPAQTIIVFSHIANFRVKIELNNNRASTRHWNPSAAWNYVPWKITGEHFNSQNSHWPSQGHQLQWFHSFYPQDLPWLQGFSSHPDGNSRRYLKPQIPGIWGCGYSISLRWKQSKTGSFWVFFLHLSSGFHTSISTELFKWKLLLQLHTARAGKDTCPPMNIFPAL